MLKLTPIEVNSKQSELTKYIALELVRNNFDAVLALPTAIGIMGVIQKAIDTGNLSEAMECLKNQWREEDQWWIAHHPK